MLDLAQISLWLQSAVHLTRIYYQMCTGPLYKCTRWTNFNYCVGLLYFSLSSDLFQKSHSKNIETCVVKNAPVLKFYKCWKNIWRADSISALTACHFSAIIPQISVLCPLSFLQIGSLGKIIALYTFPTTGFIFFCCKSILHKSQHVWKIDVFLISGLNFPLFGWKIPEGSGNLQTVSDTKYTEWWSWPDHTLWAIWKDSLTNLHAIKSLCGMGSMWIPPSNSGT